MHRSGAVSPRFPCRQRAGATLMVYRAAARAAERLGVPKEMTFSRVRALIFVAVLFVTATIVVVMAIGRDTQTKITHRESCAAGEVPAKNDMPERNQVTVNVYNGTQRV